jgi:hypothetical protein
MPSPVFFREKREAALKASLQSVPARRCNCGAPMVVFHARKAYLNALVPFGTTYAFQCTLCRRQAQLGPLPLFWIVLIAACFFGLLGVGCTWEGLGKGDSGESKLGLVILAFAGLLGLAAYLGFSGYWKHPRVRQPKPR